MFIKSITYTDYDGNERTEIFRFNFTRSELVEMDFTTTGGLQAKIETIVAAKDQEKIMRTFKDILMKSYGEKSPDGRRFVKSPELSEAFAQTEAYDILFMELLSDEAKASEFIKAIIPSENAQ